METPTVISTGVAEHIGSYADAVAVPAGLAQVHLSGTPGLTGEGTLPEDFADEARQAWRNVVAALDAAGASLDDIVVVRQWLTSGDDIAAYSSVRSEFVKHRAASMLGVVDQLVWPAMRVEVEVVAVIPAQRASEGRRP